MKALTLFKNFFENLEKESWFSPIWDTNEWKDDKIFRCAVCEQYIYNIKGTDLESRCEGCGWMSHPPWDYEEKEVLKKGREIRKRNRC